MKVRVIRSFIDKYSMEDVDKGTEFEVTEERFSELTAGPRGVFVEEIKEDAPENPPKEYDKDEILLEDGPLEEEPPKVEIENLTKKELVEYGKDKNIELNMEMTKAKMIEILLKK